jgi:hypothetical protein
MPKFAAPLTLDNLTETQRDLIVSPNTGDTIYNTTSQETEYWDGTSWVTFVDAANITTTPLGSIDEHSDVDTTTITPIVGDSFIYDGSNWVPSSTSSESSNNYIFSYKIGTQSIGAPTNTWKDVTFDINGEINGWVHTPTSADFVVPATSLYAMTVEMNVEKSSGGSPSLAIRVVLDGALVAGSHNGMDITSNNTTFQTSRTLLFNATAAQVLKIQVASSATSTSITPPPDPVGGGTPSSAAITIRRLT